MIHNLMGVLASQALIGEKSIGVEGGTRFDMLANLRLKIMFLAVGDHLGANLAAALKDAQYSNLVFGASSGDATGLYVGCMLRAFPPMNVSSASTSPESICLPFNSPSFLAHYCSVAHLFLGVCPPNATIRFKRKRARLPLWRGASGILEIKETEPMPILSCRSIVKYRRLAGRQSLLLHLSNEGYVAGNDGSDIG